MWGCFLMSGVKILHFLKDWWKSIPIHQNYTMALKNSSILSSHLFFKNVSEFNSESQFQNFLHIFTVKFTQMFEIYTQHIVKLSITLQIKICRKKKSLWTCALANQISLFGKKITQGNIPLKLQIFWRKKKRKKEIEISIPLHMSC